ncbi:DNA methyltransferase [Streptomyces sp. NPDC102383]|uniref:DNA methyltransferase n=1 Tax=Streptomyces sp. NPDC102383 TaxID=3366165 RepID=UPI0037FA9AB5
MNIRAPHPFPARMAPELALRALERSPSGSKVLDPMCGSGTVLRTALASGHNAIGIDMDPLAVLMATVWSRSDSCPGLGRAAERLLSQAKDLRPDEVILPWIDEDKETSDFIDFWFAEPQRQGLRKLAYLLHGDSGAMADALRLALSRIIITKDRGASLARDVSHSRPHRVGLANDYSVAEGFRKSAVQIERRLAIGVPVSASVSLGDARKLSTISDSSVDLVITSPPYLNAIDYLRGHRLALVWLGYKIGDLRQVRGSSVGAEKVLTERSPDLQALVIDTDVASLANRMQGVLYRYARDMLGVAEELKRVLKRDAPAVLVVGNSTVRGTFVDNAAVVRRAAESVGFVAEDVSEREIPTNRRYLPPPSASDAALDKRMRKEVILTLRKG